MLRFKNFAIFGLFVSLMTVSMMVSQASPNEAILPIQLQDKALYHLRSDLTFEPVDKENSTSVGMELAAFNELYKAHPKLEILQVRKTNAGLWAWVYWAKSTEGLEAQGVSHNLHSEEHVILHWLNDGRADTNFGDNGVMRIQPSSETGYEQIHNVFFQNSGGTVRVIVHSSILDTTNPQMMLIRYRADGKEVDSTFGQNGILALRQAMFSQDLHVSPTPLPIGIFFDLYQGFFTLNRRADNSNVVSHFDANGHPDKLFGTVVRLTKTLKIPSSVWIKSKPYWAICSLSIAAEGNFIWIGGYRSSSGAINVKPPLIAPYNNRGKLMLSKDPFVVASGDLIQMPTTSICPAAEVAVAK